MVDNNPHLRCWLIISGKFNDWEIKFDRIDPMGLTSPNRNKFLTKSWRLNKNVILLFKAD